MHNLYSNSIGSPLCRYSTNKYATAWMVAAGYMILGYGALLFKKIKNYKFNKSKLKEHNTIKVN